MKRILGVLLGVSLAGNVYLALGLRNRAEANATTSARERGASPGVSLIALETDPPSGLRDRLRAAGVDEALIRAILQARLSAGQFPTIAPTADPVWWRDDPGKNNSSWEMLSAARRARERIDAEVAALMGESAETEASDDALCLSFSGESEARSADRARLRRFARGAPA